MARKKWSHSEARVLIENYNIKTIRELEDLLPGRGADSINAKIKRLKNAGKIKEGKTVDAIRRAYDQRN